MAYRLSKIKLQKYEDNSYIASAYIDTMNYEGHGATRKKALEDLYKDVLSTLPNHLLFVKLTKELAKKVKSKIK